jgi:DNA-binding transcriptional MerR regulator
VEKKMYYIGEVEEICKITKKALRHYDRMGVLPPDEVSDNNGYRCYSEETLLHIPRIKYYKQSGFKLDQIKTLIEGGSDSEYERSFREKIDELHEVEKELHLKMRSIKDWYDLVLEAEMVIDTQATDVSVKYIDKKDMVFLDREFDYNYMASIINIEFTNYIENIQNAITGPVIIAYPSFEEKMSGKCKKMRIIQESILVCKCEICVEFGGAMFVSCYHIGRHQDIDKTYKKMKKWISAHGYSCEEGCYERYVMDYWTTKNSDRYVTEVLIKIKKSVRKSKVTGK